MDERATGLILRTRPLTETSLIVEWLTRDLGRISTVAKGARRPKSTFRGKLDLFYLADFSFQRSRRSDLHTLREVSLVQTYPKLRQELISLRRASYAAGLLTLTTEADTPLPAFYTLMLDFLQQVAGGTAGDSAIFALELKLLEELGLNPRLEETSLSPGSRKLAERLRADAWPQISRLKLTALQSAELRTFLKGFLEFHLGKVPGGRDAALQISNDV